MDGTIEHYGVKRRSGRYPWGSGGDLLQQVDSLKAKGLNEKEIAAGFGMSTTELRSQKTLVLGAQKEAMRLNVIRQKESGMSIAAISREFNIPASTVADMLKPHANMKFRVIQKMANLMKKMIGKDKFIDVGDGTEIFMGITRNQMDNAVRLLANDGYEVFYIREEQLGTGKKTSIKVLGPKGSTYVDAIANKANIEIPNFFWDDGGQDFLQPGPINNVPSDRVLVKYRTDGGGDKDGLIEMRRGVPELNLGDKTYAQVRIGVDGTHYMKGMAVLRDDIPDGYDLVYNTSKLPTLNKLDAMKVQEENGVSKFGAVVKPNTFERNGKTDFGVVNIVGEGKVSEEGAWAEWNKTLASQVLSKQAPKIAQEQLDIVYKNNLAEFADIDVLTNPTVRQHLMLEFADKVDKQSMDLKAAALPRQSTNVLLPDPGLKPTEIYAPNYNNGDEVVLVRYPHGGVFEIPTLRVNNKTSEYRDIIGTSAKDAVAIHPDVAQRLSGADFDGDTVLVIPNAKRNIRTAPALDGLKNFDPITAYPYYDGMKPASERQKERMMGDVSNLITDMTIKGASQAEIARAVRHSMVVIDSAKHELNYKQSAIDNGIGALKENYQGSKRSGASTLISKAKSEDRVLARHDNYSINPETGEKVFTHTGENWVNKKTGKVIYRTQKSHKLPEAYQKGETAYDLSSGTVIEKTYADHADKMVRLGNQARKATLDRKPTPYNRQARETYATEVEALDRSLKAAIKHRPIERKAQLLGNEIYKQKVEATPGMSEKEQSVWKGRSLTLARTRLGASKPTIDITPRQWEAIEMGAVSPTKLKDILRNADMDLVRTYATPRASRAGLSTAKQTRAKALQQSGYTNAEIANALGVPVTAIRDLDK